MRKLPFSCPQEAKENSYAAVRSFEFFNIHTTNPDDGMPMRLGLQRIQDLIAKAFGFVQWIDLISTLNSEHLTVYLDTKNIEESHRAIAVLFSRILNSEHLAEKIKRALSFSAFGCSPKVRNNEYFLLYNLPCKTIDQWHELINLQSAYAYHSRYDNRRSEYENKMLKYWHDKAVAELLGTKLPSRPAKPRKKQP